MLCVDADYEIFLRTKTKPRARHGVLNSPVISLEITSILQHID